MSYDQQLPRDLILDRLAEDLIGPKAPDEVFQELPTDRYLTGILFPRRSTISAEEDDGLKGGSNASGGDDNDADDDDTTIRLAGQAKPSTMGLSFSLAFPSSGARLGISIRLGTYRAWHIGTGGSFEPGPATRLHDSHWRRTDHHLELGEVAISAGYTRLSLPEAAPQGLELHCQALSEGKNLMVTLALVNANDRSKERYEGEERTFFQVGFEVRGVAGSQILRRPFRGSRSDEDGRLATLIYRNIRHHAVGHTCSAAWSSGEEGVSVRTEWLPRCKVPGMSPRGGVAFEPLHRGEALKPLSAKWLASASQDDLVAALSLVPSCYEAWVGEQELRIPELELPLQEIARSQLDTCRGVQSRIRSAVALLGRDADVRRSFQLANHAIALPRQWSGKGDDLVWRPFQIAFFLLALESVADSRHRDREIMDLLWFPTGGGKTEAYLGIIAFLLFHRRLRHRPSDQGGGTAAFMRYTLRALTIQQFQRAAGLVLACEHLRRDTQDPRFGNTPFSIGLWVGGNATPNKVEEAVQRDAGRNGTHRQLRFCPCCASTLQWDPSADRSRMAVRCCNKGKCCLASFPELPVYTIDEDVYRVVPSLLIGTVDKFAQIARKSDTGRFFGLATDYSPPDLIIQDELHLISGPLGTIAGLYEVAIDHLCSRNGVRPKILGSTATIRRAGSQIRSLFDRKTCQFPPPGLDHDDSGFAVVDQAANGRLHVGVTTAGRSPKFTLQAVSSSLLQSATCQTMPRAAKESYSTLLVYFNSLRELGGALVLMQDDVHATIDAYSQRRKEDPRELEVPEELTSRKSAAEIRTLLEDLEKAARSPDVLLASNMISVGVDIQRLALMVVNGQPKTIAEYIQATSRVGRGDTAGLVVSIYNNSRTRDRSHYESFSTWHEGIYREVEATSVTPFAARAVEKALHATLVSLVRHLVPGMRDKPRLSAEAHQRIAEIREVILRRVERIDSPERDEVSATLDRLVQEWTARHEVDEYWVDHGSKIGLMISAEQHAAKRASGQGAVDQTWPTPNSMRDVEPSTMFRLGFPQKLAAPAAEGQIA